LDFEMSPPPLRRRSQNNTQPALATFCQKEPMKNPPDSVNRVTRHFPVSFKAPVPALSDAPRIMPFGKIQSTLISFFFSTNLQPNAHRHDAP
jgi:hypothetical protein